MLNTKKGPMKTTVQNRSANSDGSIHCTVSRKKFFLAKMMREISREKFNARNARKTGFFWD